MELENHIKGVQQDINRASKKNEELVHANKELMVDFYIFFKKLFLK